MSLCLQSLCSILSSETSVQLMTSYYYTFSSLHGSKNHWERFEEWLLSCVGLKDDEVALYISVYLSIYLSIYLSVYLSIYLSIYLFLVLSLLSTLTQNFEVTKKYVIQIASCYNYNYED